MKRQIREFLKFNGRSIYMLAVDGTWWIAIKPICEALGVDFKAKHKILKKDEILNQLSSIQTIVGADGKPHPMSCLPERYIYGWIFGLESKSEGLARYKMECHDILFDYFHGTITQRSNLLMVRQDARDKYNEAKDALEQMEQTKKVRDAKKTLDDISKSLDKLDDDLANGQLSIF
jgi:hypothetical protein